MSNQDDEHRQEEGRRAIPPPGEWATAMDEIIEEAMRQGAFDNLPGQGKPLNLSQNLYASDRELAYQLLKDNDYTLPWIAARNQVLARVELFREEVSRVARQYQAEYRVAQSETIRLGLAAGWQRHLVQWQERIADINQAIANVNLKQPDTRLEIFKLTLERELARAGAAETLA
ncbi:MAG: DUF1992 domain-containing protein [Chloroflexi bacterium]|nr:DUF1992 domain-containing protein [Chloroflexota bacterium]MCI0577415.1 DUF1992 domain-containing protein [Chloroflexota bacterium]MCI0649599.1 DUF1992 domain-containing protein [Chloroflexota bacterium]MCI0725367.1 DUF1992 domain-containing protein [Chloroflexota bacterium]